MMGSMFANKTEKYFSKDNADIYIYIFLTCQLVTYFCNNVNATCYYSKIHVAKFWDIIKIWNGKCDRSNLFFLCISFVFCLTKLTGWFFSFTCAWEYILELFTRSLTWFTSS